MSARTRSICEVALGSMVKNVKEERNEQDHKNKIKELLNAFNKLVVM